MSTKVRLQNNNVDLQTILDTINTLPEKSDAYGVICVTYPKGGVCTCTNGSTVLAFDNTLGYGFFMIPEQGEWTVIVEANNGSGKVARQPVTITDKGQFENVNISFGLYLFQEGVGVCDGFELIFGEANGGQSVSPNAIVWSTIKGTGNTFYFKPQVDCSKYSKLYMELKCGEQAGTQYQFDFGVGAGIPSGAATAGGWYNNTAYTIVWDTTRNKYYVDLTNVSGLLYVKMEAYATTGEVYNVWLEE